MIRHIIVGKGMISTFSNYFKKGTNDMNISLSFLLFNDVKTFLVNYSIGFKLSQTNISIENEMLSCMEGNSELQKLGDKETLFAFTRAPGLKDSFLSLVESTDSKTILNYLASSKTTIPTEQKTAATLYSSLFNDETMQIIQSEIRLSRLIDIVNSLVDFCKNKFLIVTTKLFDIINVRGVGVNGFDFDDNQDRIHKNFSILFGKQTLEESKYNSFLKMLQASSKVLETFFH